MSNNEFRGIILLHDEPQDDVLSKWLSFTIILTLFVMMVIYMTNYFAKSTECFSTKHTGILGRDNLLSRWMANNAISGYALD